MQMDTEHMNLDPQRPDGDRTAGANEGTDRKTGAEGPDRLEPDRAVGGRRVTTQEAAEVLGITVEAVRARIRRGTLTREKAPDGTVFVWLTPDQARQGQRNERHLWQKTAGGEASGGEFERTSDRSRSDEAVIEALREQIAILRAEIEDRKEEARRKDAIIMTLSERLPERAPVSSQESSVVETVSAEGTDSPAEDSAQLPKRRSWLVRFFFGP